MNPITDPTINPILPALALIGGAGLGRVLDALADFLPRYATEPVTPTPDSGLRRVTMLLAAVCSAALLIRFGLSAEFVLMLGACAFFGLIALIDLKYRLVLNVVTYPAITLLIGLHLVFTRSNLAHFLVGGLFAFAIFYAVAWLRPGELGGGDVKLAVVLGLAFGFPGVLWALIIGAGVGAAAAVLISLLRRERRLFIPYAPFLCLGAAVALLYNPFIR